MVYKVFQKISLERNSLFLQVGYAFLLYALVLLFDLNKTSFLVGFVFSYFYMGLFFYSIRLIFSQKRRLAGFLLLFSKWLFLLLALILVAWFLDGKAFLVGLSGVFVFLLSYVLKQFQLLKR